MTSKKGAQDLEPEKSFGREFVEELLSALRIDVFVDWLALKLRRRADR